MKQSQSRSHRHCRYCGGGAVDLPAHEENCVMRNKRAVSEIAHTNSERTAVPVTGAPLAGRTVLHDPAPERKGEIAPRESLEAEGGSTSPQWDRYPWAGGRHAERLDGGERPAPIQRDDKTDGQTPRTDEAEVYYSEIVTGRDAGLYWVKAEFAQQIERELNAAQSATAQADSVLVRRDVLDAVIRLLDNAHCFAAADALRLLLVRETDRTTHKGE